MSYVSQRELNLKRNAEQLEALGLISKPAPKLKRVCNKKSKDSVPTRKSIRASYCRDYYSDGKYSRDAVITRMSVIKCATIQLEEPVLKRGSRVVISWTLEWKPMKERLIQFRNRNGGWMDQEDFQAYIIESDKHSYPITDDLHIICSSESSGEFSWTIPNWLQPGIYKLCFESLSELLFECESNNFQVVTNGLLKTCVDVGIWCRCGSYELSNKDAGATWISCSNCLAWNHWDCYSLNNKDPESQIVGFSEAPDRFMCWFCFDYMGDNRLFIDEVWVLEMQRAKRALHMIKKASIGPRGGYARQNIFQMYNTPYNVVVLLKRVIQVLLQSKSCYLIHLTNPSWEFTFTNTRGPCIDLGAGMGMLSMALPPGSESVEINSDRIQKGRVQASGCVWIRQDVLSEKFYKDRFLKYQLIVCNPDFEVALPFLYVALYMLSMDPCARIVFLLPSDFFEASNLRTRLAGILPFQIEFELKLGHLSYLEDRPNALKRTVDSLFIIKRNVDKEKKFVYESINARLAGLLS